MLSFVLNKNGVEIQTVRGSMGFMASGR